MITIFARKTNGKGEKILMYPAASLTDLANEIRSIMHFDSFIDNE